MYNVQEIKDNLTGLVGWRQSYDATNKGVSDALTESESGLHFQDAHPLVTLDNMRAIAPRFSDSVPEWSATSAYAIGELVQSNDLFYTAIAENTDSTPPSENWGETDLFSNWLQGLTDAALLTAVRNFWDSKIKEKTAKNLLESRVLYNGAGRLKDTITNTGSWAGFEIIPARYNGIVTKIDSIGVHFNGDTDIDIKLFHSSQSEALESVTVNFTGKSFVWQAVNWSVKYDEFSPGGSFFIVYDQNQLGTVEAVNKAKDWSKAPCCDSGERAVYNTYSKYVEIAPFKVEKENDELWDMADNIYTSTTSYGLNLKMSIGCDVTYLIIQHKTELQNLIQLQLAVSAIRTMVYNPEFRINRNQQNVNKMELLYELDGDSTSEKQSGLNYQLKTALKAAKVTFTGLDKVCLPCNNKGVRYKST